MKVVLFVAFSLVCLLRTSGAQLQCLECDSRVSYDDCQNKSTMVNCSSDHACFQSDAKIEKGGAKNQEFEKGCLNKSLCEAYNKGEIEDCILAKNSGDEVDCKAMCCHEDGCNMEDILVNKTGNNLEPTVESTSSSTTGADEKDSKGSAFAISVMILLSGLLLTLVNIN